MIHLIDGSTLDPLTIDRQTVHNFLVSRGYIVNVAATFKSIDITYHKTTGIYFSVVAAFIHELRQVTKESEQITENANKEEHVPRWNHMTAYTYKKE